MRQWTVAGMGLAFALSAGCATTQADGPNEAKTPTRGTATEARQRPVVAVFTLKAEGLSLSPETLARLSGFFGLVVVESGAFRVVPQDQVGKRLRRRKADSYRQCYERECQIEIGRELAANKVLAGQIVRLGRTCTLSATLYDLRSATADGAASLSGACTEEELAQMIPPLIARLTNSSPGEDSATARGPELGGTEPTRPRSIRLDCDDCEFAVDQDPRLANRLDRQNKYNARAEARRRQSERRRAKSRAAYESYRRQSNWRNLVNSYHPPARSPAKK